MATLSTLVIKRLRNVVTNVTGRVFGAPTFLQALLDQEFHIDLPNIFVIDERDTTEPRIGGQVTYQDISTEIDLAVAISRINKEQEGKDLEYLETLSDIKDQIFEALMTWGFDPQLALAKTGDALDNVDDHGPFMVEYVGSDNTLARNGYLFHVFTFRFNYMIDGAVPPSVSSANLANFFGDLNDGLTDLDTFEVT